MTDAKRFLKVFLCHASADKPIVCQLYSYLEEHGIQPWLDIENLLPGQDWQREIPLALEKSDAIIICLSNNSVDKKGYIQKEIKFALDKVLEMPQARIFLIPVRLEECEIPDGLNKFQWVDLFDDSDYSTGYSKLMKALTELAIQLGLLKPKQEGTVRQQEKSSKAKQKKSANRQNEKDGTNRLLLLIMALVLCVFFLVSSSLFWIVMEGKDKFLPAATSPISNTIMENVESLIETTPTSTATMTFTPKPISTMTPTSTPITPIACDHPSITKNVFPQLDDVESQSPMFGPMDKSGNEDKNFLCRGVYDTFHTGPMAVRIEYTEVGANGGWFGIAIPKLYDISGFTKLCFWAYAESPNQDFRLKLKSKEDDGQLRERWVDIDVNPDINQIGEWVQFCTDLSEFSKQGTRLDRIDNVNLGFNDNTGSATVWVDDFEFK